MDGLHTSIYVTNIEKFGDFLKVWGQIDQQMSEAVEKTLGQVKPQLDQNIYPFAFDALQVGLICIAKYKDNQYYRARITNVTAAHQHLVEVHFIDFGNRDYVALQNLFNITQICPGLVHIQPQAREFVLANIIHLGADWDDKVINLILNELRYTEFQLIPISQVDNLQCIKLMRNGDDIAMSLFSRGIVLSIASSAQYMMLQTYLRELKSNSAAMIQTPSPNQPAVIGGYKGNPLEPGTEHPVYVSYVSDGPCDFYIQLQKLEENLIRLMQEINNMSLVPLEDSPVLPGTVCVARCQVDDHICRAVVTGMGDDGLYKVFYVDFGNTEILPAESLYNIPFRFVIPKVMAMRYTLAGIDKQSVTVEMKCAFKDFVNEKLLRMRVISAASKTNLPQCILWDQSNTNVIDVMKQVALVSYPEQIQLNRGFTHEVRICFVYSCSRFYVQLKSKEEDLRQIMAQLQQTCPQLPSLQRNEIRVGLPCCALFDQDGQWYRAEVLEIGEQISVAYIDYGNVAVVAIENLRKPSVQLVTSLRPQALECCLNGYQNMEENLERDNLLEELILEKEFTMKVIEMHGNRALVDLIDQSRYNVASRLLEKIAAAHSQVSPMLVHENNVIEHRKSSRESPQNKHQRPDSRITRDNMRAPQTDHNRDHQNNFDNFESNDFENNFRKDSFKTNNKPRYQREEFKREEFTNNENFRKKPLGRIREDSEKSFSDSSEKNWRKPRNNDGGRDFEQRPQRNNDGGRDFEQRPQRNNDFDKRPFNNRNEQERLDYAPKSYKFEQPNLVGRTENVTVTWFHNPNNFYCQLEQSQGDIRNMMEDIQKTYADRKPVRASQDSTCIALFKEDQVLYRAQVLELQSGFDCKVRYVDFGNAAVTNKVWPLAKNFIHLPMQAVCCSLKDIVPVGENWSDTDDFSSYFDKDSFTCTFIEEQDEKFLVKLECGTNSISDQLVNAGLAKYAGQTQETVPEIELSPIEISVLLSQTIPITIKSINSMEDFIVKLESGHQVKAALHNLASATTVYEDVFREWVEVIMIMYVDNVLDDKLEITLYDTEGNKLNFIEPDEGAFETIDPLCPLPVLTSTLYGWVSSATANSLFLQPNEYLNQVAVLTEEITKSYNEGVNEDVTPEIELICAALSSDEHWYRCKIVEINQDNATISYLDYGNLDDVHLSKLKALKPEFQVKHALAVEILVKNAEKYMEQMITVKVHFGENGWEGSVEGAEAEDAQEQGVPQSTEDRGVSVVLSHVDSPNEFYLQLAEALDTIDHLQETLQAQVLEFPDLENPVAGVLCVAPYSVDQQWYRAQVLDADGDITTVRFVDYGNTDVLTNSTKVKTLSPELLAIEQHARKHSLNVKPVGEEWSAAAQECFENLTNDKDELFVKIVHEDEKTTYVNLFADNRDVGQVLIDEGHAQKNIEVETTSTGYISHLNSPSEFWIQLESSVGDLEWTAEQLTNANTFPELEDLTPGSLCAALFPEDEMWYRARILSNSIAGLEVVFIDYGNSCNCNGLRQLPEELVLLPPLAQKSSLQKPPGYLQWPVVSTEKFKEISADGATIFTIKKLSAGETTVVQLLSDGRDFINDLLPETENGSITSFESITDFVVTKSDGSTVDCELEPLPGFTWNDKSSEQLSELANNGTAEFQVEKVSEKSVRLYLNGQDIRINLDATVVSTQSTPRKRLNIPTSSPNKGVEDGAEKLLAATETCSEIDALETPLQEIEEKVDGGNEDKVESTPIDLNIEANELEKQQGTVSGKGETEQPNVVASVCDEASSEQVESTKIDSNFEATELENQQEIVFGKEETEQPNVVESVCDEASSEQVELTPIDSNSEATELENQQETVSGKGETEHLDVVETVCAEAISEQLESSVEANELENQQQSNVEEIVTDKEETEHLNVEEAVGDEATSEQLQQVEETLESDTANKQGPQPSEELIEILQPNGEETALDEIEAETDVKESVIVEAEIEPLEEVPQKAELLSVVEFNVVQSLEKLHEGNLETNHHELAADDHVHDAEIETQQDDTFEDKDDTELMTKDLTTEHTTETLPKESDNTSQEPVGESSEKLNKSEENGKEDHSKGSNDESFEEGSERFQDAFSTDEEPNESQFLDAEKTNNDDLVKFEDNVKIIVESGGKEKDGCVAKV